MSARPRIARSSAAASSGGLIGLFLGLLPALLLLYIYGAERGIKAIALIVPVTTFTTGLIIGLVKAKREWK